MDDRSSFELFTSEVVVRELEQGDPDAARARLKVVSELPLLAVEENARNHAVFLLKSLKMPNIAVTDALHLAIVIAHEIEYLLTWNCRHLANAQIRRKLDELSRKEGWLAPVICTPEELINEDRND